MSIGLTPEQQQLADAVTQFGIRHAPVADTRAAFDTLAGGQLPSWWKTFTQQGFHAVHLSEAVGGQGGSLVDTACMLEAAGTALLPGPVLPTVLTGAVAMLAQDTRASKALLTRLAYGVPAALILPVRGAVAATAVDDGWRLHGSTPATPGVCAAQVILLGVTTDDQTLWCVVDPAGPGVTVEQRTGTDKTVDVGVLRLDGHVVASDGVLAGVDELRAHSTVVALTAGAAAGAVRWCVDAVTGHLRTREQFGKPIGAFQALQHQAAMLLVNCELATAAAWDAVRALSEPSPTQHQIAAAGAALMAIAPAPDLVFDALTMFGAIGFTWEHDLHLYWRKATSLAASIGPAGDFAETLGALTVTENRDVSVKLGDADAEFRRWIADTLDHAMTLRNDRPGRQGDYENLATGPQRTLLADAGLIAPHWPKPWGVAATQRQLLIIDEEFAKRPALVRPSLNIAEWILPTIISSAPEHLQQRFIPPTQRGDMTWCQLFSEPGAGSDLASLTTKATKVDGGWRINGHKIWTSSAHVADYGALLARTDPDAAKHRGIGYFIVDMRSDGVELHPIRQVTGEAHFNEVFLNDVFVPDEMLLGGPTDGWNLAIATMAQERVAISGYVNFDRARILRAMAAQDRPDRARVLAALGEADAYANAIKVLAVREVMRLLDGQAPGPTSSIAKVAMNVMLRRTFKATLDLAAPAALVEDADPAIIEPYFHLPAELIGGGTKEIQLNIIAQMILGLPRG
ncbi:acyl-CoA dehydrogenase family protein [Mycobacterium sp. SMC-4]|uniref:acyl-CoA dehydrogenase family protein n=1 Tax=Mycobacterium sp. SMC-4 TaxID=2857059 RepID=UPI003D07CDC2